MPRPVYYQDVGNPLQVDRLPKMRPEVSLPTLRMSTGHAVGAIISAVLLLFVTGMTTLLTPPSPVQSIASPVVVYVVFGAVLGLVALLGMCRTETMRPTLVILCANWRAALPANWPNGAAFGHHDRRRHLRVAVWKSLDCYLHGIALAADLGG